METFLAWTLPFVAAAVLLYAARRIRFRVVRAIVFYLAFSLFFGCIHFLLYRHNPTLYQVKEAQVESSSQGEISIEPRLEQDLTEIAILDAVILQMEDHPTKAFEPLAFTTEPRQYPLRYSTIDVETRIRTALVGPDRNEPVYSAIAKVSFVDDYRGIRKGTERSYSVGSPDKDHLSLEEPEFSNQIIAQRRNLVTSMSALFQPGTIHAVEFSLPDFFYFSFSIVGVGEVIPASSFVRALVFVQILCTFVIPFTLDWAGPESKPSSRNGGKPVEVLKPQ
jgi:hypothetical protein